MRTAAAAITAIALVIGCGNPEESQPVDVSSTGPDTIRVTPADTIGIMMGDSNYVFGTIADAVHLDNGDIAVLDEASCRCMLFDSGGNFINQVSRRGAGPGEVIMPGGLIRLSDNSIAILDHASGIHRFSPEGEFLELMTDFQGQDVPQWAWGVNDMGYVGAVTSVEPVDDNLIVHFIIARWDEEPDFSVEYFRNSFPFNPQRMDEFLRNSFFSAAFAGAPDGMVYVAPISSEEYRIDIFNPDGSLRSTIQREMPRVEKSQAEIDDETALITAILKERGVPEESIMYEPDPYRWMIQPQGLGADGEGRVWVSNGASENVVMDVYSRDGEHLAVVEFEGVNNQEITDYLNIKIQPERILIYSLQDPSYPKLYLVDMPEIM